MPARKKYRARGRKKPNYHNGSPEERLAYGISLLKRMLAAEAASSPNVEGSERHKGALAYRSLSSIAALLDEFAGWAVDHQLGLAISGDTIPLLPSSHGKEIEPGARTKKALAAGESHNAEAAGSALWQDPLALEDGAAQRLAIYNIVSPMLLKMFPRETAGKIRKAFEGVEFGFLRPFFDPPSHGRQHEKYLLRLKALCCMKYDGAVRGYGYKDAIYHAVAEAYGALPDTVRKWQSQVAAYEPIGREALEREMAHAEAAGQKIRQIKETDANPESVQHRIGRSEAEYGQAAIEEAGRLWRGRGSRSN